MDGGFVLSGAIVPIEGLPGFVRPLAYIDPLTYRVDGLHAALVGASTYPFIIDFGALVIFPAVMVGLGAFLFERVEAVRTRRATPTDPMSLWEGLPRFDTAIFP